MGQLKASMSLKAVVCADQQACPVTRPSLLHPWRKWRTPSESPIWSAILRAKPWDIEDDDDIALHSFLFLFQTLALFSDSGYIASRSGRCRLSFDPCPELGGGQTDFVGLQKKTRSNSLSVDSSILNWRTEYFVKSNQLHRFQETPHPVTPFRYGAKEKKKQAKKGRKKEKKAVDASHLIIWATRKSDGASRLVALVGIKHQVDR